MGYRGNVYHIPLVQGLNANKNEAQRSPSDLEEATNVATHDGALQKDFGEDNINSSTLTNAIRAGIDYYPLPTSQRTVIATSGGKIQKSSGTGDGAFSDVKTGLTGTAIPQFVLGGAETTATAPKLFLFNGADFPQYLSGDGSSTERVGFRASLTDKLSTTNGDPTLNVEHTAHGLTTGMCVSLVGFTNPLNGQNPNVANGTVTVINANNFTVEMAGNANATTASTGGTGKYYAHPVDWTGSTQPDGAVLHGDRLIAWLGNNLYGSSLESQIDFEVAGDTVSDIIFSGVGAQISLAVEFQNRLIVFKNPTGIIQIESVFTADQIARRLPVQLGVAGKNAWCYAEGDLLFISNYGSIHSMGAIQEFGDVKASSVTGKFYLDADIKAMIDVSKLSRATMTYDAYSKVAYAAYCKKGSSENDLIIKIDLSERERSIKLTYTDKGSYVSLWTQKDTSSEERVVAGSSNGYLRNMNSSVRAADGETDGIFESSFKTTSSDLRDQFPTLADVNKHFDFLEFNLQPTNTTITLNINIYIDGDLTYETSVSRSTTATTFPLTLPVTFSTDAIKPVQVQLVGCYGRKISVEMTNSSATENFRISDLKIKFRQGDARILA